MARYWREGLDREVSELRAAEAGGKPEKLLSKDAAREKEILDVMKQDIREYYSRGLDVELAKIRARRSR
jgi:hypothetical protein